MTRLNSISLAILLGMTASASSICSAAWAASDGIKYEATLNGGNEVPATESKGTGEITATYDSATKRLSWKGTYTGLTGPVTAAHFHGPAKPGENAGVLVPVTANSSPFSGEATLDDAKAGDFQAGRVYFNLHTAANPKGEIRGQVEMAR